MTLHQTEALLLVAAMFVLFAWDRIRYDMVATLTLLAALVLGVVPPEKAFSGFGNQVIGVIAAILVVSRAIAVSGTISRVMERLMRGIRSPSAQIGILTACTTFLSAFIKNVGTLGIFIPVATHTAERSRRPVSLYLMPLAFGSLIGGTITQIGTSPNLLISVVRADQTGTPFSMFDFTPVSLPLSIVSVMFLAWAWRVIPANRRGARAPEQRFEIAHYVSELRIPPGSPAIQRTVADLEAMADGDISIVAVTRPDGDRAIPAGDWTLSAGEILAIQADPVALKKVIDKASLELLEVGGQAAHAVPHDVEIVEAVVMSESPLIGRTPRGMHLRARYEVNLLAVSRQGHTIRSRLRKHVFAAGDLVILQGLHDRLPDTLVELGCLPLADRSLGHARRRNGWIPLTILAIAMLLVALKLMNVGVAVFGTAVLVVALRQITLKEAYESIDGPVIVMLGSLIPVGEALKETGATDLLGAILAQGAALLPATMALGLIMVVAMLVTPLLHHAAAVIVMGPIAAVVARNLGYHIDPFLMAVALGASCDFLTPIGHQNNAIIMARGGYRFADYWRLGLPLSILVAVAGTLLIAWVWPL